MLIKIKWKLSIAAINCFVLTICAAFISGCSAKVAVNSSSSLVSVPQVKAAAPTPAQIAQAKATAAKEKAAALKVQQEQQREAVLSQKRVQQAAAEAKRQEEAKGIGLSYDQVTAGISDKMDLSDGDPVNGRRNTAGQYGDHGSLIQVIGDHDNVWQASVTVVQSALTNDDNDPSTSTIANGALTLLFMHNITPQWPGGTQWLIDATKRAQDNPNTLIASKAHGIIRYTVTYRDTLTTVIIEAKRADNPSDD